MLITTLLLYTLRHNLLWFPCENCLLCVPVGLVIPYEFQSHYTYEYAIFHILIEQHYKCWE